MVVFFKITFSTLKVDLLFKRSLDFLPEGFYVASRENRQKKVEFNGRNKLWNAWTCTIIDMSRQCMVYKKRFWPNLSNYNEGNQETISQRLDRPGSLKWIHLCLRRGWGAGLHLWKQNSLCGYRVMPTEIPHGWGSHQLVMSNMLQLCSPSKEHMSMRSGLNAYQRSPHPSFSKGYGKIAARHMQKLVQSSLITYHT